MGMAIRTLLLTHLSAGLFLLFAHTKYRFLALDLVLGCYLHHTLKRTTKVVYTKSYSRTLTEPSTQHRKISTPTPTITQHSQKTQQARARERHTERKEAWERIVWKTGHDQLLMRYIRSHIHLFIFCFVRLPFYFSAAIHNRLHRSVVVLRVHCVYTADRKRWTLILLFFCAGVWCVCICITYHSID